MRNTGPITRLRFEQCRRWRQGDQVHVEAYLEQKPGLWSDPEGLLDLIYNEVVLREQNGEAPQLEEYLQRFPEFESQLRVQFEVHQVIQEDLRMQAGAGAVQLDPNPDRETQSSPPAGITVPGYEILDKLGRGGMGVVYLARHVGLKRRVALKMIRSGPHASPAERARFHIEAEAVARLQHPNIVQIYEVNEHEGIPYLSLELVEGGSLDDQLHGTPWPIAVAAAFVETLARTMHYAHQQGIIHRDLKPGNVLLTPTGVAKITDFGLAKLLDADASPTTSTGFLGTPHYMAPEQTAGPSRSIGPAADIYALGAILYELLTGKTLFEGATSLDVIEQVRAHDPSPPSHWQRHLPRDLETICLKCLAKDPRQRYATALDLAEDLRRFQAGEPIRARPVSVGERLRKWSWRHRTAVGLGTLALLVLVLVGIGHHHQVQERERQARAEEAARQEHAREVVRQFVRLRDEALFHGIYGTLFTDVDSPLNLQATRAAIQEALDLVQFSAAGTSPPVFDPCATEAEQETLTLGCYQLLLLLAETVAHPRTGQSANEQPRQALAILERAAGLTAPTQAYHLRRARYLTRLGDAAGAKRERARADELPPSRLIDFLLLGEEHYRQGEIERARRDFENASLLKPDDLWSQYFLAVCLLRLEQPAQAAACLTRCLDQRPGFIWTYLLRSFANEKCRAFATAEADYEAALERQPNQDARYFLFVNRGRMRLEQQRFTEAVADLRSAVACKPNHHAAYLNLARTSLGLGKEDEAARWLKQALAWQPPGQVLADYHYERGCGLYKRQHHEAALQASEEALAYQPASAGALELRARALMQLRRYEPAARAFDRRLGLRQPGSADLYRERGFVRMQLRDYLGAVDDFSQALQGQPDATTWTQRGWAYFFADAWKPALRDFEQALQRDPQATDGYVGRGLTRVMLGQYRAGVRDAEEALRRQPAAAELLHNIACIYAQAASRAEGDAAEADRLTLAADYRRRALAALRDALALLDPSRRGSFWRENVLTDPALAPLREDDAFQQLGEEISRSQSDP